MATEGRMLTMIAAVLVALLLGGCGGTSLLPGHHRDGTRDGAAGQDGPPADPAQVAVVKEWSRALQAGDVRGAARYFHLPSVFADGTGPIVEIRSLADAEAANASLPCGASFISAFRDGRYVNVLFRLTARRGQGGGPLACGSGVGSTARTEFLITRGRILEWVRAPTRPGDPGVTPGSGGHVVV